MAKLKAHLNQLDIDLLIQVMKMHFVTQDQFTAFRSEVMDNFDKILKNTTTTSDELVVTQSVVSNHTIQIRRLEDTLNITALT